MQLENEKLRKSILTKSNQHPPSWVSPAVSHLGRSLDLELTLESVLLGDSLEATVSEFRRSIDELEGDCFFLGPEGDRE